MVREHDPIRQNVRNAARLQLVERHRDEYERVYAAHQDGTGVDRLTGKERERARARARARALVDLEHLHQNEFEDIHHRMKHEHGLNHIHAPEEHHHDGDLEVPA